MFSSTVLEVAIGLVFCYASVALITSSIYEAIASQLNFRSNTLLTGIQGLLNVKNEDNQELLLGVYNHALASPLGDGVASTIKELKQKPSYMDARHFAVALVDTIRSAPGDFIKLGNDIDAIKDPQIKKLLRTMYDNSAGKIENLHSSLATWFDTGMDRVSGSYKRQSQRWCFVIALIVTVTFNIDSFNLFTILWQHPSFVSEISSPQTASEAVHALEKLPIGWQTNIPLCEHWKTLAAHPTILAGWLITASTSLFGGPFWFDLLNRLINLRGTGTKPQKDTDA
jgi:hypothetical protein